MLFNKDERKSFNERKESELFELSNDVAFAVNSTYTIPIAQMPYSKYKPFNYCVVTNNSGQKLRLLINDSVRKIIPAGTIQTFDASTIPAIWSIRLVNLGSADVEVETINVAFQKVAGLKSYAQQITGWGI